MSVKLRRSIEALRTDRTFNILASSFLVSEVTCPVLDSCTILVGWFFGKVGEVLVTWLALL